jgi:hypothetical protein
LRRRTIQLTLRPGALNTFFAFHVSNSMAGRKSRCCGGLMLRVKLQLARGAAATTDRVLAEDDAIAGAIRQVAERAADCATHTARVP